MAATSRPIWYSFEPNFILDCHNNVNDTNFLFFLVSLRTMNNENIYIGVVYEEMHIKRVNLIEFLDNILSRDILVYDLYNISGIKMFEISYLFQHVSLSSWDVSINSLYNYIIENYNIGQEESNNEKLSSFVHEILRNTYIKDNLDESLAREGLEKAGLWGDIVIIDELRMKGVDNFDIAMDSALKTFRFELIDILLKVPYNVNPDIVKNYVNQLLENGYEESDERIVMLREILNNYI
jgi:hypothetical protein